MRVAVDQARNEDRVGELEALRASGSGDTGMVAKGGDLAFCVNKNGAVLEGRRRDGMNPASSDTEQELRV